MRDAEPTAGVAQTDRSASFRLMCRTCTAGTNSAATDRRAMTGKRSVPGNGVGNALDRDYFRVLILKIGLSPVM